MFRVEDFFGATALKMRMLAQHVDKVAPGDAKQHRRRVHVNRNDLFGPCGEVGDGERPGHFFRSIGTSSTR